MITKTGKTNHGLVMGVVFFAVMIGVVCYAESALKQYTVELEKKHQLLNAIHENSDMIASGMGIVLEKQEAVQKSNLRKLENMAMSGEDLSKILAPTTKITVQPPSACGTLQPESNSKVIRHVKEGESGGKE